MKTKIVCAIDDFVFNQKIEVFVGNKKIFHKMVPTQELSKSLYVMAKEQKAETIFLTKSIYSQEISDKIKNYELKDFGVNKIEVKII